MTSAVVAVVVLLAACVTAQYSRTSAISRLTESRLLVSHGDLTGATLLLETLATDFDLEEWESDPAVAVAV